MPKKDEWPKERHAVRDALLNGDRRKCATLVKDGACASRCLGDYVNMALSYGKPRTVAYWKEVADNVGWLVQEHGANVDHLDGAIGREPIHGASYESAWPVVEKLLELGAKPDCTGGKANNYTPLHAVSINKVGLAKDRIRTAKALVDAGADINLQRIGSPSPGDTPLHTAINWERFALVNELAKWGADVNIRNEEDIFPEQTPLEMLQERHPTKVDAYLRAAEEGKGRREQAGATARPRGDKSGTEKPAGKRSKPADSAQGVPRTGKEGQPAKAGTGVKKRKTK